LQTRRGVLGDAYVERSLNAADDFNWPMQKLATEFSGRNLEPAGTRPAQPQPPESRNDRGAQPAA